MLKFRIFIKDLLLALPLTYIFKPLGTFFHFIYFNNLLIQWIYKNRSKLEFNDFYKLFRNYNDRIFLYEFLSQKYDLPNAEICYLEFGVASGDSFNWWMKRNTNANSAFVGFDTFSGLPEDFGALDKGTFACVVPTVADNRGSFVKGLFQDTLLQFIETNKAMLQSNKKIMLHLDADLYTATLYVLTQLHPYFKKGDLIMFDEFNVAIHEFKAFSEYINSYYTNLKPIGAAVNFNKVAFEVI